MKKILFISCAHDSDNSCVTKMEGYFENKVDVQTFVVEDYQKEKFLFEKISVSNKCVAAVLFVEKKWLSNSDMHLVLNTLLDKVLINRGFRVYVLPIDMSSAEFYKFITNSENNILSNLIDVVQIAESNGVDIISAQLNYYIENYGDLKIAIADKYIRILVSNIVLYVFLLIQLLCLAISLYTTMLLLFENITHITALAKQIYIFSFGIIGFPVIIQILYLKAYKGKRGYLFLFATLILFLLSCMPIFIYFSENSHLYITAFILGVVIENIRRISSEERRKPNRIDLKNVAKCKDDLPVKI